jgi:hypothetical protein
MKKLLFILLLAGGTCAAQRHPYSSRPYHAPDRQPIARETRRLQPLPPVASSPKPQPVSAPAPKPESAKRR